MKLFIALIIDIQVTQLKAMVGLSLKEITSSQPMDVQYDKLNKHKNAHQTVIPCYDKDSANTF
jgi:hypothetical protein